MHAKDVMTTVVITATAQTPIEKIAKLMLERRISAVPVLDAEGRVEGIVSEGDLIRRAESGTAGRRSWWLDLLAGRDATVVDYMKSHGRTAGDVMTREVLTIGERTPLAKIATLLERHRIKRVPVVRNGRLVGIVSRANLLQGLVAEKAASGAGTLTDARIRSTGHQGARAGRREQVVRERRRGEGRRGVLGVRRVGRAEARAARRGEDCDRREARGRPHVGHPTDDPGRHGWAISG